MKKFLFIFVCLISVVNVLADNFIGKAYSFNDFTSEERSEVNGVSDTCFALKYVNDKRAYLNLYSSSNGIIVNISECFSGAEGRTLYNFQIVNCSDNDIVGIKLWSKSNNINKSIYIKKTINSIPTDDTDQYDCYFKYDGVNDNAIKRININIYKIQVFYRDNTSKIIYGRAVKNVVSYLPFNEWVMSVKNPLFPILK